jgi:hypothetical protein
MRTALPLRSLVARLRRGLLVHPDQTSYTAFALNALRRFETDLLHLFRTLNNTARRMSSTIGALVERTASAVALLEEKERTLTLNLLCCA